MKSFLNSCVDVQKCIREWDVRESSGEVLYLALGSGFPAHTCKRPMSHLRPVYFTVYNIFLNKNCLKCVWL